MMICEFTCQEAGERPQQSSQLRARLRASSRFPDLHTLDSKHYMIVRSSRLFLFIDFDTLFPVAALFKGTSFTRGLDRNKANFEPCLSVKSADK